VKLAEKSDNLNPTASLPLKRKREDAVGSTSKKNKTSKGNAETIESFFIRDEKNKTNKDVNVLPEPETKSKNKKVKSGAKHANEAFDAIKGSDITENPVKHDSKINKKEKRKWKSIDSANEEGGKAEDDDPTIRHAGVFSKFQKALDKAANKEPADEDVDMNVAEEEPELHGLSHII